MKLSALLVVFFYTLTSFFFHSYAATDSISFNQSIRDGETMVSASGSYELGFFSPLANTKRYLGVWYKFSNETVVWVANREMPLNDTSGILQVTRQGILAIRSSNNITVWQSSSADDSKQAQNPIAQILDTGNFVVREADDTNEDNYIWQSFDYLGDTFLPGSKMGRNLVSGMDWHLQSWKSISDPSLGDFTKGVDIRWYPQTYTKKGETILYRSGPWNGLGFGGVRGLNANPFYAYHLVFTDEEIYLKYVALDNSIFFRMILTSGSFLQQFIWNTSTWKWDMHFASSRDKCDSYALCGAFGSCDISNSPMCSCLEGFMPKFPWDWKLGNWSGGCVRKNNFVCGEGERFQIIDRVKLPDSRHSWFNRTMNLTECERECIRNCSCSAYSTLDISTGSGCLLWIGELLDTRIYVGNGQFFYLRLSTSESNTIKKTRPFSSKKLAGIVAGSIAFVMVIVVATIAQKRSKSRQRTALAKRNILGNGSIGGRKEDMELLIFGLNTIAVATNNFSSSNKLGEGGFGAVYKGTLVEGQDIAVKRLSKSSGQGLDEFKTEVTLIAKLQHRNLVRLLGSCIHEDEKMLVYEYMPNNSLDSYISDTMSRKLLDWNKRNHIIAGIARGLLYLHQDSRLRIIHRDLKASNILLDNNLNPKISDFGLARTFGADQTHANTKRVVGTYGYMAPEYAVDGLFSMKSDVFSFGVLVLEIVSGKKNRGFYHPDHDLNLLGHAWMLWTKGTPLELIDECLADSCNPSEVTRCIHVALLCVQHRPENRPIMSTVVQTLSGENLLSEPQQPGFFIGRYPPEAVSCSRKNAPYSSHETTITVLAPR